MKAVLILAGKSAWSRRLTLGIALIAIALSSALLLAVERVRADARESFTQAISGVDLVVGARGGSVQLMLYAVFRSGSATNNISWQSYSELSQHPAVLWSIPISLGDSHRGYAVLGTEQSYFAHFRYGRSQKLSFAAGKEFTDIFHTVLGSEVAKKLGYKLGDKITLTHGTAKLGIEHADKPFSVVGILSPTGTPVDRTVHISLEAITAIHLDWVGGAPMSGVDIPADKVRVFDLQPKEITAMMIGLKSRSDVFRLQRYINNYRGEPLIAVLPGVALDELWRTIGTVEKTLLAISAMVVLIGLAGLMATMLAGMNERRRELAILRALGAKPHQIFLLLIFEGLIVTILGVILGVIFLFLAILFFAGIAQNEFGIYLSTRLLNQQECILIFAIIITGIFAAIVPGIRALKLSLSDGLTPKN